MGRSYSGKNPDTHPGEFFVLKHGELITSNCVYKDYSTWCITSQTGEKQGFNTHQYYRPKTEQELIKVLNTPANNPDDWEKVLPGERIPKTTDPLNPVSWWYTGGGKGEPSIRDGQIVDIDHSCYWRRKCPPQGETTKTQIENIESNNSMIYDMIATKTPKVAAGSIPPTEEILCEGRLVASDNNQACLMFGAANADTINEAVKTCTLRIVVTQKG